MEELFEYLKIQGFTKTKVYSEIHKHPNTSIIGIVDGINKIIINNIEKKSDIIKSRYNYVISDQLAGGNTGCAYVKCREKKIEEVSNYVALYADHIWLKNGFFDFEGVNDYNFENRESLADEIYLLWKYKPLFDKKYASISADQFHFCKKCLRKFAANKIANYENTDHYAANIIYSEVNKSLEYYFEKDNEEFTLHVFGPEDLLGHKEIIFPLGNDIPKQFLKYKKLNERIKLSNKEVNSAGFVDRIAVPVLEDFCMQNWYMQKYNCNYLTDRSLDVMIAKSLYGNKHQNTTENTNDVFNATLPYLQTTRINKLIELREKEGEAFHNYRKALNDLLHQIDNGEYRNIEEAFNDLVKPEIDAINNSIKKSISKKLIALGKDMAISGGLIAIGLYAGILPQGIGEIVSTIGGFDIAKSALLNLSELLKTDDQISENPYYFLWKAKSISNN